MSSPVHECTAPAPHFRPLPSVLIDAMRTLSVLVRSFDGWLAVRRRMAADRDVLANMSDRELGDIGLPRASVTFVSGGGRVRDDPF
jgi:uncharacterized protein YjiS (DUF1127 family)